MIHIFKHNNGISIIYVEETLSEEEKARATLVLEELPPKEYTEEDGYYVNPSINKNNEFQWVYKKIPEEKEVIESLEERIRQLEEQLASQYVQEEKNETIE